MDVNTESQMEQDTVLVPKAFLYDCLDRLDRIRQETRGTEMCMRMDDLRNVIGYCLADEEERAFLDRVRKEGRVQTRYYLRPGTELNPGTEWVVRERRLASPYDEEERMAENWKMIEETLNVQERLYKAKNRLSRPGSMDFPSET